MIKIKYNNQSTCEAVTFSRISDHIISLKGATENNSGFTTYRLGGKQLGDFSDYATTYRLLDGEVQYSNDGSVYVEPQTPEQPSDTQPTQLDRIEAQVLYTALMTDTILEEA